MGRLIGFPKGVSFNDSGRLLVIFKDSSNCKYLVVALSRDFKFASENN